MVQDSKMSHANIPQALTLLNEMTGSVQHVATLVDNMLQKVRKGELTTDQGLSFLEMKYNMLLSYLINLTFVVLKKCTGEKIEGDPCIDRLVEIRTVLEKIKPINHKLKYQIDKLVKTAVTGSKDNDPTSFKPNPDSLINKLDELSESDSASDSESTKKKPKPASGVYIPPKFSAVHYNGDEKPERSKQLQERSKKRAVSSSILQDLKEEYLDTPVEVSQGSRAHHVVSKQQQERQRYEEEYLTRLPVNKTEKHAHKQMSTLGTIGDEITNFGMNTGKRKRSLGKTKGKNFKRRRFN